ncbi:ketoacyl-synt-domain-containing protein [Penicillium nucicola]|uniref:ketoacyl-synt-domain-containing protein n=1 Tax=Penicillium nucicola TaxID=1850975 RepID=UPI002544E098|nr:ketoacyl-synt-domain-containing protein [Penicillium nucicola]KAJ5748316.1 ketoacyl-synt-domain-containing protein [Penicillium nucicola]
MKLSAPAPLALMLTWLCACTDVVVAKDAPTVIAGMEDLRQSVERAHTVFESYDGGWLKSLALGHAVWDVYSSTKSARGKWESAPPFEHDDMADILVTYHDVRRSIADVMALAGSKGSVYDKGGIRLVVVGTMQLFENERSEFQQAARAKIPESFHDDIAGPVANLQMEFQTAMKALTTERPFDSCQNIHLISSPSLTDCNMPSETLCHDSHAPGPEALAIVGMAMRLPGGINTAEDFWDFLINKKDGHCAVPGSRYNVEAFYHPARSGSVRTQSGYFLQEDPAYFDNQFFSLTPYEASRLDPQQRLLLEVIYECMENGGQVGWRGQGRSIGCFVGVFGEDWYDLQSKDTQRIDRYHVLGTGNFALSNRISYEFDFTGPSMTLATGCSASMVGLHEACQAVLAGDCESAVVAGTNLILTPTMTTTMSDNLVLSPTGVCRTFDAGADGYGRGEGVNAIYVKRLVDAMRDGDPVRAVIRSTATNCDGRTPGITTPGSATQMQLIRKAYQRAQIQDITNTGFFECHGTGTVAGDTAETSVVAELFRNTGVLIGSVKPNVGHSEGASGITSIIKTVLALEKRIIPPNIFFKSPNPGIPFKDCKLTAILEPGFENGAQHTRMSSYLAKKLLIVSAATADALSKRADDLIKFMHSDRNALNDVAYTLGLRRERLKYRSFAVASSNADADFQEPAVEASTSPEVTLVFTGQGAQWVGMSKELLENCDDFRNDIQLMDKFLQSADPALSWSIEEALLAPEAQSHINDAQISQPVCVAIQIALANLLRRWGIVFSAVVGHSSGEIAAAYAAGAISLRSAILVAYHRGRLAQNVADGSMAAIGLSRAEVTPWLAEGAVLACENSPSSTTIAGEALAVSQTIEAIRAAYPDAFCRMLRVKKAYHSRECFLIMPCDGSILISREAKMQTMAADYTAVISSEIEISQSMIPMYSTVTGEKIADPAWLDSAYWSRNLTSTVEFNKAVRCMLQSKPDQNRVFIEIGPHSVLQGPLRQIFDAAKTKGHNWYIPTLIRGHSAEDLVLQTAGMAFNRGVDIDLLTINGSGKVVDCLPRYPWQHTERHWSESRISENWRHREFPHHELLGSRVLETSPLQPSWRNVLQIHNCTWLGHHKLFKDMVFPCAGYVAMVGEAIRQHCQCDGYEIRNLTLKKPLFLQETSATEILTSLRPERLSDIADSEWFEFSILAMDGSEWGTYCQGKIRAIDHAKMPRVKRQPRWTRKVESRDWYQFMARLGLNYGQSFQRMSDITTDPVDHLANATVPEDSSDTGDHYLVHPTAIDQGLQLLSVAMANGIERHATALAIPASIDQISVIKAEGNMWCQADTCSNVFSTTLSGNVSILTSAGSALVITGARFFSLANDEVDEASTIPLLSQIDWAPCLDLISPEKWLPFNPEERGVSLVAEITCFYILEAALQIVNVTPATEHLEKYQLWLKKINEQLLIGKAQAFLKIPWRDMDKNERFAQAAEIRQKLKSFERGVDKVEQVLKEVFEGCSGIIEGRISPLEVLTMDRLRIIYDFVNSLSDCTPFLSKVGHWNPRVRVLEIGAGTGATCAQIINSMRTKDGKRTFASYAFTDVSPAFLSTAAERFSQHKSITFHILDITKDPLQQGFMPASYDLIVASNVIHTTPSLSDALKNVHKLLAPGGFLLLQELCPDILYTDFIMGILPGWWNGTEDGRVNAPYVKPERWHTELIQAGFTGAMCATPDGVYPFQQNANIISRRPVDYLPPQKITLLSNTSQDSSLPWNENLERELTNQGYSVNWATLQSPPVDTSCIISLLDLSGPALHDMNEVRFEQMKRLFSLSSRFPIIYLTRSVQMACEDPRLGLVLGLSRALRREIVGNIVTIELDALNESTSQAVMDILHRTRQVVSHESLRDDEYVVLSGQVYVGRVNWRSLRGQMQEKPGSDTTRCLSVRRYGLLDSLFWEASLSDETPLEPTELELDVHCVGLNFRDLMIALGVMGESNQSGIEASAIVRRVGAKVTRFKTGNKVVVCSKGLFRTRARVDENDCIEIPPGLSFEDAATIPAVYATSFYSLVTIGQLQPHQIYATAGLPEKRSYLHAEYGIPMENIFSSRDDSFHQGVMSRTGGAGVDLVLNSLAGSLLHASWQCVAKFGKMVELGKRDFLAHGTLSMDLFGGNRSFFGVDMLSVIAEQPELSQRLMTQFVDWYKGNKIRPIRPIKVFEASEVIEAFKYMQSGRHMGKIVIQMPKDGAQFSSEPITIATNLSTTKSYLLVGGLGGIGRAVANWLVEQGARHLIFLSRSAGRLPDHRTFACELERQGCEVAMISGDVSRPEDIKKALSSAAGRVIGGVIQMSMVLQDESLAKMTHSQWLQATQPKVDGTLNLHRALEVHESGLDFFVLFSSMSGVVGTVGQSNYAAANSFLDAFVTYRRQLGRVASVLNLGIVEDIGVVHHDQPTLNRVKSTGARLIREDAVIDALHAAILPYRTPPNSVEFTSSVMMIGVNSVKPLSAPGVTPLWGPDIRFSMYENLETHTKQGPEMDKTDLKEFFAMIEHSPELLGDPATEVRIMSELCKLINAHMSRDERENDDMASIPIDSLMSIEIRNWFRRQLGMEISLTEISKAGTVGGLSQLCVATLNERYAVSSRGTETHKEVEIGRVE